MPSDVQTKADVGKTAEVFAALPQTQCTRCGFPDCQSYANAIVYDGVAINQCSPGGAEGIARLSQITGQAVQQLNPENGIEGPRSVAFIDENWCIGCTLCIDVCPTDAILGGNKMMHTVIEPHCTGCELCIPVCPVDCIELENVTGALTGWAAWSKDKADAALVRYKMNRFKFHSYKNNSFLGSKNDASVGLDKKSAVIEAALAKARAKRA
jgi:Na+-translocating ferredoxin:NAD+ oxidoreductase subunit B